MTAAPTPARSRAHRLARTAAGGLGRVLLLGAIALLAATYVPSLLGYHRYVLVGHSMEPHIHRGSLVFDRVVPVAALRRGDVITYVPPGLTRPVTHRIVSIRRFDGRRVFRTKGDNNPVPDPRPFTLDGETQARFAFAIPLAGWVFMVLADPSARLWIAVIPGILLALWAAAGLWRQGGELLREQRRTT
jgi:signal peptidase I